MYYSNLSNLMAGNLPSSGCSGSSNATWTILNAMSCSACCMCIIQFPNFKHHSPQANMETLMTIILPVNMTVTVKEYWQPERMKRTSKCYNCDHHHDHRHHISSWSFSSSLRRQHRDTVIITVGHHHHHHLGNLELPPCRCKCLCRAQPPHLLRDISQNCWGICHLQPASRRSPEAKPGPDVTGCHLIVAEENGDSSPVDQAFKGPGGRITGNSGPTTVCTWLPETHSLMKLGRLILKVESRAWRQKFPTHFAKGPLRIYHTHSSTF